MHHLVAYIADSSGAAATSSAPSILVITAFLSVFHMYATMLVGTVARLVQNENGNCHAKICTWYVGANTANVNVTGGVLSAMRKAYGVICAVEKTVCQAPIILEETETGLWNNAQPHFFIPAKMRFVKNNEPFGAPKFMQK